MNILESIILGIVQGLTEFLPVSSSGHLVLLQNLFGVSEPQLFLDIMLHVGTLVSVVIIFFKDIVAIFKKPFGKMTWLLVIATIPAIAVAILFNDLVNDAFTGMYLAFGFILTGIILTVSEMLAKRRTGKQKKGIHFTDAGVMGVMQAIAIFPGVSRSGSTISGGLFRRVDRRLAARFSFLMSIPVIIGAVVMQAIDLGETGVGDVNWLAVVLGMVFAAVAGFVAVKFMLALITRHKLYGFAVYVGILGALVLIDQLAFNVFFINPFA